MDNGREDRRPGEGADQVNDGKEQKRKYAYQCPQKSLNKVILTMKGLGSLVKYLRTEEILIKLAIVVIVAIVIK